MWYKQRDSLVWEDILTRKFRTLRQNNNRTSAWIEASYLTSFWAFDKWPWLKKRQYANFDIDDAAGALVWLKDTKLRIDAASHSTFDGMDATRDNGLGFILDHANRKFGTQSVGIGYAGIRGKGHARQETSGTWNMKRQKLSNRGTTRWDQLVVTCAR
ncbi:MAG: DUF4113 domain-containing protein [Bifidobacterium psychraerophilum]|uniref:DUF4113 domain-containing protein n=1 Tax=Bifidobacterium psychraerophilum TaxID=218140 RepID=UPI0039E78FAF